MITWQQLGEDQTIQTYEVTPSNNHVQKSITKTYLVH